MSKTKIMVILSRKEWDALLNDSYAIDGESLDLLKKAKSDGDQARLFMSPEELDFLLDGIAAEANHASSKAKQRMWDGLYNRLGALLDDVNEDGLEVDESPSTNSYPTVTAKIMEQMQTMPQPDLGGLSMADVERLCFDGWWKHPAPIELQSDLPSEMLSPIRFLKNARVFLQALREANGVPATAAGNLPRKFVADMLTRLEVPSEWLNELHELCKVVNESDFHDLFILRIVCQMGGLIRRHQKRFIVSKHGRELLAEKRIGALYGQLFNSFFYRTNLAVLDRAVELPVLQQWFPFALWRLAGLSRGTGHLMAEVEQKILPDGMLQQMELEVGSIYFKAFWLVIGRFLKPLEDFGLLTIQRVKKDKWGPGDPVALRINELFDRFISFKI